jgi:hypothetical protein
MSLKILRRQPFRTANAPLDSDARQLGVSVTDYLMSARFWFESFQNWQSEFLVIASMVWLAVYLRQ